MNRVAIIGQGYVGLSLALSAYKQSTIVGFDIDVDKVKKISSGISPLFEVPSAEIQNLIQSGNYICTSNPELIRECQTIVIAVPTPLNENREPDLSILTSACGIVKSYVSDGALIINESTSFPGTLRKIIAPIVSKSSSVALEFASSPERVDPGRADFNQANTPRLYSGLSDEAFRRTYEFYSTFCNNLVKVSSPEIAESAKLFENSFRQVNIAFVNEFATIMHSLNIPVREVLEAANTKPFGIMKFDPGIGVGGHCIPVDPSYLAFAAKESGHEAKFIELANKVNLEMPNYVISRLKEEFGDINNLRMQVIGIAYKPNVSDHRESPSIKLIEQLRILGLETNWCDPVVHYWNGEGSSKLGDGDLLIFTVPHAELIKKVQELSKSKRIFDVTGKLSEVPGL